MQVIDIAIYTIDEALSLFEWLAKDTYDWDIANYGTCVWNSRVLMLL